jgi:hypothetical protein
VQFTMLRVFRYCTSVQTKVAGISLICWSVLHSFVANVPPVANALSTVLAVAFSFRQCDSVRQSPSLEAESSEQDYYSPFTELEGSLPGS